MAEKQAIDPAAPALPCPACPAGRPGSLSVAVAVWLPVPAPVRLSLLLRLCVETRGLKSDPCLRHSRPGLGGSCALWKYKLSLPI